MRSLKSACLLALPVVVAAACSSSTKTHGQLMVVIDTDMSVPNDIDSIGLVVSANGGVLYNQEAAAGAGNLTLPATIGIVEGSSPGEPVTIKVLGRKSGSLVVLNQVVTTVPDGRLATLRMPLQWLCVGQAVDGTTQDESQNDGTATSTCAGSEQSCVAGTCTSEVVVSSTLATFDPAQIFGGASGPGTSGQCFDTLGCFSSGYVAAVDTSDCTVSKPAGGTGVNVSIELPLGSDGICGSQACLVPLDQAPSGQAVPDGWTDLGNGRLQLPTAVCAKVTTGKVAVAVTTSCTTKTPALPTCGPWSSASDNLGTMDAGAPDGSLSGVDAGAPSSDSGAPPTLDAGTTCAAFSIDQSACDVIANTGCTKGLECTVNAALAVSTCETPGTVALGGTCDSDATCGPGLYCLGATCAAYCCNNEDCPTDGGAFVACSQQAAGDAGAYFGVCQGLQ